MITNKTIINAIALRCLEAHHYEAVKKIYNLGIVTGHATFQTEAPTWEQWDESHLKTCRLAAVDQHEIIVGWAALTPVSGRCVYSGVAEVSVYVHPDHQGKGVGKKILQELIHESEKHNLWTLQAGIFPENIASLKIHKALGFRKVGYREKIGKMKGIWRDTILLERRSELVGV
jgi:L-amino acid N-acyltransferase YncA